MSVHNEKRGAHAKSVNKNKASVHTPDVQDYTRSVSYPQLTAGQLSKNNVPQNVSRLVKPNIISHLSVNEQFIGDTMRCEIDKNQHVLVFSDMGTGKTFGMVGAIIDALPLGVVIVVTHLKALVKGNEQRLVALLQKSGVIVRYAHYSDSSSIDIADAQVVFTTLHNLHSVVDKIGGADRAGLVMFDESESVAQMMTADIMDKSREQTITALESLAASKCKLVMLDAHLDASTHAFCNAFLGGDWAMLDNSYQRWAGTEYQWIKTDNKNAEKAGIEKVVEMLKAGKNIFVTSGSKAQAIRIYNTLKKLGLLNNREVLKAWGDGKDLQDCKDNHDLFNDYGLVIATPAVGTGISIEPRNDEPNFNCVVSFITRHKQSPDAVSAMQMPFRVRQTRENKIWLVECDFAPDSINGLPEFIIQRDVKKQIELYTGLVAKFPDAIEDDDIRRNIFGTYAGFAGAIALHKSDMWGEFWGVINNEFERKGMTRAPDIIASASEEIKVADKAARVEAKEDAVLELFEANDLHQEQAAAVELKERFGSTVTETDKKALEKYKLVANYADDDYNPLDIKAFKSLIAMKKRGYVAGCNRIANAHLALIDINKIVKAWTVTGNRQKDATSMDALKIKIEWKLDRILCNVVGISQTDDGYQITAKTIQSSHLTTKEKGHAVTRQLSEIIDDWNATHTEQRLNRKLLQEDALTFVAKLLSNRLKLNVKVKDDFIDIADNQPAVNLLTKHSKRGAVGLAKLVQAIDTEQAEAATVEEQPKKKDAVTVLKQAWADAGKPCHFDDVLAMFLPDRQYIEDENGYSVSALTKGIIVNIRAGNLRAA